MAYNSNPVENYLSEPQIHHVWESSYHNVQNESFFEQAFSYIGRTLNAPQGSTILDAGCGTCSHTLRLVELGFDVIGVDLSKSALEIGRSKIHNMGLDKRVRLHCANLRSLPFGDESFSYVLCWGVLMHVPVLEETLLELSRIVKQGGTLVIGENNMLGLQALVRNMFKSFIAGDVEETRKTYRGVEYWRTIRPDKALMTRHTNIGWLIRRLKQEGFTLEKRVASQFTDAYTRLSSPRLQALVRTADEIWFNRIKVPHLAFGNILVLRKCT